MQTGEVAGQEDYFGDGVIIADRVTKKWWNEKNLRESPFMLVLDADKRLFAIELNGGSLHQSVAEALIFQLGNWTEQNPFFQSAPSSQKWDGAKKIADTGFDCIIEQNRHTVCVFEVGYSQSLKCLHQIWMLWFICLSKYTARLEPKKIMLLTGVSYRRMVCVKHERNSGGAIPAFPSDIWSIGTAPLRNAEINMKTQQLGYTGVIQGSQIGNPTAVGQYPFVINIPVNTGLVGRSFRCREFASLHY